VTDYRLYTLDASNHINNAHDIICDSDADALVEAGRLLKPSQRAEVWQRTRLVAKIEALRYYSAVAAPGLARLVAACCSATSGDVG
jgi:hypothetical protein